MIDNTRKNPEAGGDYCDIDRDGDPDIILGQDASGNAIWWWENPYPDFSKPWTCRHIKNSGSKKHHDQTVGDFDGDGQVRWYEWTGGVWKAHTLREVIHGHTCEIRDIDGDGDLDILMKPYNHKTPRIDILLNSDVNAAGSETEKD